jgi:hypothetical protein
MPGPHNAKKNKRGRKKKKNHTNSRTHTTTSPSVAVHTELDTVPDLSSSPTLVALLTPGTPGVHEAEGIYPDHPEGVPWKGNNVLSPPSSPYGPKDDPTLILLSNPIIHDPGNGPRVKNMRAFLNSSFSQPACMDDPLCAEFAQREILQMLCTVLPEETALVRPLLLHPSGCANHPISDSRVPTFHIARSACGTTKAGASEGFAPPVFACIHWWTRHTTLPPPTSQSKSSAGSAPLYVTC